MPRKGQRAKADHPWYEKNGRCVRASQGLAEKEKRALEGKRVEWYGATCQYCGIPEALPHADDCVAR